MSELDPMHLDTAPVLALLAAYRPQDADELHALERIVQFVSETPAFADRLTPIAHITASAWVTDPSRQKALLLHHKKLDIWVQPGGHVESNDTSLPAASLRELREETGLADARLVSEGIFDIDIHGIPARGSLAAHDHMDIRFWFESSQTHTILSDESHELAWMDREAIDRVTHEASIWRMVNKTLTNR
jgi:8-oxo-dGTP pyrophosphatase MutT (NUDIX family)